MKMFEEKKNMKNIDSFSELEDINSGKENDLIILLDKSGSMYNAVSDTIGGFNTLIEREKEKNPKTRVTLVLFDTQYRVLYSRKPVGEVKNLTEKDYSAGGWTALLDAIGTTINLLDREISENVLFVITTDGLENSSQEFTKNDIRKLIENHDWEFLFIGADIDSYAEASTLGIKEDHTANYEKCGVGLGALFDSVSDAREEVERSGKISSARWKRNLE